MTRVAVVTGGSAGLGRATVRELAAGGWDVFAVLARGKDVVDAAVAEVEAAGRRGLAVLVDVSEREAVEAAADRIEAELGPIDLWVNDVMVGVFGRFLDTDPDDFERALHVTYLGCVNGTRAALSRMVPRDRGQVIQVGSALGFRGIPLQAAYCGAKHAIVGFTESVVSELEEQGSKVAIIPGRHAGTQHDPVPVGEVEAAAPGAARRADLPARGGRTGDRHDVRTAPTPHVGGRVDRLHDPRQPHQRAVRRLVRREDPGVGQQAPQKDGAALGVNLYDPIPGDHGAHGRVRRLGARLVAADVVGRAPPARQRHLGAALGAVGVIALAAGRRK